MIKHGCVWGVTDNDPIRSRCSRNVVAVKMVLHCREKHVFVFVKTGIKILSGKISFCPAAPHVDTHRLTQLRFSSLTRRETAMEICPAVPTQPGSLSPGGR